MPRFYFDTEDGHPHLDPDGTELPGLEAAKREALRRLVDVLKANPDAFWRTEEFKVVVTDAERLILLCLQLGAVTAPAADRLSPARPKQD